MSDGLLVVDKPSGPTSHDVVARVRRAAGTRRVGHAGTLDPMATGVLVVGIGRATRLLGHLALHDKDYLATIRLGTTTVTDDAQGDVVGTAPTAGVTDEAIAHAVAALTGEIEQVPSAVSAVKVDGKRSYARVRDGESVQLAARRVTVASFEVLERRGDELDVAVTCSTGTYVRALARDLGAALGTGAYLTALRRTRVGGFSLDGAVALADVEAGQFDVVPIDDAVRRAFDTVAVDAATAQRVRWGQRVELPTRAPLVAVVDEQGHALALADAHEGMARYLAVLDAAGAAQA